MTAENKHCSYCRDLSHTIRTCPTMNEELDKITQYCSNQTNIIDVKQYLKTFEKPIIDRYIKKHNINSSMCNYCSDYYNNVIKPSKEKNIDLLVGYLCVLPLHPEIKHKRQINKHKSSVLDEPVVHHHHHNSLLGTIGVLNLLK